MNATVILGGFEQGLLYALVALGLYISYRTLDVADLTTDGSFTLGAAVSAMLCAAGYPILALLAAAFCGALAGLVTATLQTKLSVPPILAGIITLTALYSINLIVMNNSPNVSLGKSESIFTMLAKLFGGSAKILIAVLSAVLVCAFIVLFMRTQLGLSVRATGDNRAMVCASSINPAFTTAIGLCMANAIIALSGALIAQYQRFASVDIGNGMVIMGLASLILGEAIFNKRGVVRGVCAAVSGSLIYRMVLVVAVSTGFASASNLKLATAVLVAAVIAYPSVKKALAFRKKRRAEQNAEH